MKRSVVVVVLSMFLGLSGRLHAEALSPELSKKLDAKIPEFQAWGKDPVVVNAVKAHNSSPSADAKAMTQEKWKTLSILDPFAKTLTKNDVTNFIKGKKNILVVEAFVSGADGTKVAMLAKTSSW